MPCWQQWLAIAIFGNHLVTSQPWFSAISDLETNRTVVGWVPSSLAHRDDQWLCFSVDGESELSDCQRPSRSYHVLERALPEGTHTLHVTSLSESVVEVDDNETPDVLSVYVEPPAPSLLPQVLFVFPAYGDIIELEDVEGSLLDAGQLQIFFSVVGGGGGALEEGETRQMGRSRRTWPKNAVVVFEVAGQKGFELSEETNNCHLSGLEPGTHQLTASLLDASTRSPLGPPSSLLFDVVLHHNAMQRHRYTPPPPPPLPSRIDTHNPATATGSVQSSSNPLSMPSPSSLSTQEQQERQQQQQRKRRRKKKTKRPWKVTYVGMLKFDGQKTIWLHQMQLLPREEFELRYLTFSDEVDQCFFEYWLTLGGVCFFPFTEFYFLFLTF